MAIRQIRFFDDPVLRKKSREVKEVDERIRMLLDDLAETMYDIGNAAGLAACQVGILKRLVVIDMGDGLIKLVNPKIIHISGEQQCIEGCVSFPNRFGRTIRPREVIVQALNENGEEIVLTGRDELAKCFCHEIDHLDGKVFIDQVIEYVR
ncbi:peptide deformylase [Candidatus Soleaferrea massiliensis]|uniref:peptide deformylase n=1 Tax=Candidatus Soleaferrea massiliensis TaxID=1470354 RepID=UPI00058F5D49|nr:peptide deformylase [Candidatus Soleaferrea massiliensis]